MNFIRLDIQHKCIPSSPSAMHVVVKVSLPQLLAAFLALCVISSSCSVSTSQAKDSLDILERNVSAGIVC